MPSKLKRLLCTHCHRPDKVCYCHTLNSISNFWPVQILQHPNERKHAIGTANIAQLSLTNCQTTIATNLSQQRKFMRLIEDEKPLLIYPGNQSTPLEEVDKKNIQSLIFLDGSWRKTRRMIYETPALDQLEKISFNPATPSRYRIRKEPNETAISTVEAIYTVLTELENDQKKYQPLLNTMDWMINKQIELMGKEVYEKNYSDEK